MPTASHSGVGKDLVTYLTDNKITRRSTNRAPMGDEWVGRLRPVCLVSELEVSCVDDN